MIAAAFGLYLVALAFYVVLPLRPVTADFCQIFGAEDPYLSPFRILGEVRAQASVSDWRSLLGSPAAQQLIGNVALFVPLGMFVHYLLRRGALTTITIGALASLAIELTQLTGNWSLYPCAYRQFDSADLVANTIGTGVGVVLAPLLRLVPGQSRVRDPGAPRPVTAARRLLGGVCDVALILAVGLCALLVAGAVLDATRGSFEPGSRHEALLRAICLIWIPGLLVTLGVPLARAGRTPGQWAVLIRVKSPGGEPLTPKLIVSRFATGAAALIALTGLAVAGLEIAWAGAALVAGGQLVAITLGSQPIGGSVPSRGHCRLSDARAADQSSSSYSR